MMNLISNVSHDIENFNFSQAGEKLKDFSWNDLADWYLEASKFERNKEKRKILDLILKDLLILWHPFMPFVTEAIWKEMGKKRMLMINKWPDKRTYEKIVMASNIPWNFELIQKIIIAIRNLRIKNGITVEKRIKVVIYVQDNLFELVRSNEQLIKDLRTGIGELVIYTKGSNSFNGDQNIGDNLKNDAIYTSVGGAEIYLIVEIDREKEKTRLGDEKENLEKYLAGLKSKLANQDFVARAPKQVVDGEKKKLAEAEEKLQKIDEQIKSLK
jgi:valyl-tRNA synthetase